MKVNISGRGVIPVINTLAPVRGVEMSERDVARLVNYRQFRVYASDSGLLITHDNIKEIFAKKIEKPQKKVEPVVEKKPTPVVETKPVVIEIVEKPFNEEEIKPLIEETPKPAFLNVTEFSPVEEKTDIVTDATVDIVSGTEYDAVDSGEVAEDTVEEKAEALDSVIEEEKTEEVKENKPYQRYNKKKYKKH